MEFMGQYHEEAKRIELDLLDRKILYVLSLNGRFSESSIAKALKTSKEVVHYRIKRLQKEDFLHGFITIVSDQKLGNVVHAVTLALHPSPEHEKLIAALVAEPQISHLKHYNSLLDLQFGVTTTSLSEFVEFFDRLLNAHHAVIKDYTISTILEEEYLGLDFLLEPAERPTITEKKGPSFQKEFTIAERWGMVGNKLNMGSSNKLTMVSNKNNAAIKTSQLFPLDDKDHEILEHLKHDARMPVLTISQKMNLATTSVQNRIQNMITNGVITAFIPYASFSYLGYQWYTLHLRTKNLNQNTFREYLHQHPNVVWLTKRLGKWNYHLSIFVRSNTEFNRVVGEIGRTFKDSIIAYDSSIVHKQYKFSQRVR